MTDFYFETRDLSVGYDGHALIHNISIGINRGEIVTLIGPNGSGKSTILKSITRQLRLIAGTVFIDANNLSGIAQRDLARRMAVVLTERTRPELMTCRDVVATGRYPYTGRLGILSGEDELKVQAAMEAVNAFELRSRDFNAISDGQRQRILLARAICQEPEIIVLDEPTSFLDIKHKLELLSILRRMARGQGITVIMSLHEIDLAQKLSDKVMCVKGETIRSFGPPEEVFDEARIRELYGLEQGFYDSDFGSMELPRPAGRPDIFVLSACGTGIPVYRRLQKYERPFYAGILYTNDIDYRVARQLASEVVTAKPFCSIEAAAFAHALELLEQCKTVINAGVGIGQCNLKMATLINEARKRPCYKDISRD